MSLCPFKTWKLYTSKLSPKSNSLWQRPKQGYIHYIDEEWYDPRPVGKDMLERFMKLSLAKSVKLDGKYTNHSICATVINTLDMAGFEAHHIIKLMFHKNESTVKEYATKCPENKRKEMFQSLSDAMLPKSKKSKPPNATNATASCSTEPNTVTLADVQNDLPNFTLQPIDEIETIDDSLLTNLIYDIPNETENNDPNEQILEENAVAVQNQTPQNITPNFPLQPKTPKKTINTQFNTINNQAMQHFPAMYFPNSNVTINYNFSK